MTSCVLRLLFCRLVSFTVSFVSSLFLAAWILVVVVSRMDPLGVLLFVNFRLFKVSSLDPHLMAQSVVSVYPIILSIHVRSSPRHVAPRDQSSCEIGENCSGQIWAESRDLRPLLALSEPRAGLASAVCSRHRLAPQQRCRYKLRSMPLSPTRRTSLCSEFSKVSRSLPRTLTRARSGSGFELNTPGDVPAR